MEHEDKCGGDKKAFVIWKNSTFTKVKDLKTDTIAYRLNIPSHREICQGCLGCLFTLKEIERFFTLYNDAIVHLPTMFLHGHSDLRDEGILGMVTKREK